MERSLRTKATALCFCVIAATAVSAAPKVKDSLIATVFTCPSSLDPQMSSLADDLTVISQIYDCLFETDSTGGKSAKPCLAESYAASKDGMGYTFILRKGIKFHNGDELTSDDVAFSLNRFISSPSCAMYATSWKNAEIVDRYTVKLNLKYPAPLLLELLAWVNTSIVNKAAAERYRGTDQAIVGTGAYRLKEWNSGESVVLTANESYFMGSPKIKTVTFRAMSDTNAIAIALMNHEIDFTIHTAAIDAISLRGNKNFTSTSIQRSMTRMIAINNAAPALKDIRVRQALNYAIDAQGVNLMASEGFHMAADQYTPPMSEGYTKDIKTYPYNVAKAKELLAQAGYTKDNPLIISLTYISDSVPIKIATAVQAMLQAAGVQVKAVPLETQAWYEAMLNRKYDIGYFEGVCSPNLSFISYYACFNSKGYFNVFNFSDPEVDKWSLGAMFDINTATRVATETAIAKRLAEKAVLVPIYYMNQAVVYDRRLQVGYIEPLYCLYKVSAMSWN